ncbi:glycosyltransferase family A protein [Elizabethkingia meningoseptica]|uniref:glycosyltransferase family A protein n=1 Tax=Elizabethkingia meningoseptica TaxID=238 RepID=UPI0008419CD0|nr:glycosyltransferase family A protein [Elizabethkingia meningoseptica]ODM54983.1 hypothetical protein BES09_00530 [Elizabethkingia meningoseptica]OHT30189.1 hypothetical protein BFF93_00535 [Elizabethkingia meningoseptica]OPC11862.1 hypothetical protein BAX93_04990 [Elizabethkingia meningoseptica]
MLLTIITPTYNRAHCLPNIYNALLKERNKDFEWIIIDDGSIDDTCELVNSWINENKILIRYIKKENAGKTNALLTAFDSNPKGQFSLVLDSDDYLVENFYDIINNEIDKMEDGEIGFSALKSDLSGNLIGSRFNILRGNYIDLYFGRNKSLGDKIFIVNTNVYKDSLVKTFAGEKLIPESVFYINMAKKGNYRFLNQVLYKGDYLNDGLSFDVIKLASKNINGFILEKQILQTYSLPFFEKIKNEVKYIFYSFSGSRSISKIFNDSNNKFLTLFFILPTFIFMKKRIENIRRLRQL